MSLSRRHFFRNLGLGSAGLLSTPFIVGRGHEAMAFELSGLQPPDDGGRRIQHGNVSGFMAIALFLIDRLNTRKRQGRIASGLDLMTQGGLVILELNDQMRVRRCRCFEGFF